MSDSQTWNFEFSIHFNNPNKKEERDNEICDENQHDESINRDVLNCKKKHIFHVHTRIDKKIFEVTHSAFQYRFRQSRPLLILLKIKTLPSDQCWIMLKIKLTAVFIIIIFFFWQSKATKSWENQFLKSRQVRIQLKLTLFDNTNYLQYVLRTYTNHNCGKIQTRCRSPQMRKKSKLTSQILDTSLHLEVLLV